VGTATGPVFTYLQAPAITTINPATATAGTSVTITGTNFNPTIANDVVKFNGTVATVTTASATQLTVTVPAGGSSGNVTVTTLSGTSNGVPFTYAAAGGPSIYVVGSDTQYGYGYWTNSIFTPIINCTNPYAMVGSGPDLYIAGPASSNTPTYWKNSTAVQLSAQTGYTFSICLSGPDIYCLGNIGGSYYVWKNGVQSKLSTTSLANIGGTGTSSYLGNAIAVDNGNVYVAGSQQFSNTTISKATYWKNGTPIDLTDGITSGSAWATAVYISGVDVYVAGFEAITASNGGIINKAPRLWKNGVSVPLATPGNSLFNSISCILVSGNNVYVGGQYNGAAAVWKNGVMINVPSYALAEQISSMFLYNNTDLYITGASSASGNNCYWKNGNFVEMDPGCHGLSSNCANTSANQAISIYVH
jgi:uncharacterized protein (TIGR03437 family)